MRRVAASFIAMSTGWAVMNAGIIVVLAILYGVSSGGGGVMGALSGLTWWLMISAFVVSAAWVVVYLPLFALMPRRSCFWKWTCCVPLGILTGAVVPFGFWVIPIAMQTGEPGALLYLLLPATVGGVAAVVGRLLVDWSRHYSDCEALPGVAPAHWEDGRVPVVDPARSAGAEARPSAGKGRTDDGRALPGCPESASWRS